MNNRIFWAIEQVAIKKSGLIDPPSVVFSSGDIVFGAQSVGVTSTFNLEQAYQLGQLSIYENIENLPDIEVNIEKVLDGQALIYHLCTPDATASDLVNRASTSKVDVGFSIFNDIQPWASGTPIAEVFCSGMYINSITLTFPIEGNCTESVSLVGNDKFWRTSNYSLTGWMGIGSGTPTEPLATGGIQRRENVSMANCLWPTEIPGISASGTNDNFELDSVDAARIQTVTVSVDLGRTDIFELGMRKPYYKYVNYPVEVTCAIEIIGTKGDFVDALSTSEANLTDQQITIQTDDSTVVNLGDKNKLASVDFGGADAGGGNATITYNYSNFNVLTVTHPKDPAGL